MSDLRFYSRLKRLLYTWTKVPYVMSQLFSFHDLGQDIWGQKFSAIAYCHISEQGFYKTPRWRPLWKAAQHQNGFEWTFSTCQIHPSLHTFRLWNWKCDFERATAKTLCTALFSSSLTLKWPYVRHSVCFLNHYHLDPSNSLIALFIGNTRAGTIYCKFSRLVTTVMLFCEGMSFLNDWFVFIWLFCFSTKWSYWNDDLFIMMVDDICCFWTASYSLS